MHRQRETAFPPRSAATRAEDPLAPPKPRWTAQRAFAAAARHHGVIRVTRIVSAVAAGGILNTKTAASQIIGGVEWGIGMALHEETLVDQRFGRIMNVNIAEYHVPVNASVRDIVIFVDEPDNIVNPLGSKGLAEIGIVGVAAAIANAIHHATGKRVRDLPITLGKSLR